MLTMIQVKYIRKLFFEEGKNVSEIKRETGHDRKTINIYLEKEDWNEEEPTIKSTSQFPKLDPYKEDIDTWLLDDKKAKVKQRHTAQRVFNRLNEKYKEEFDCSYRSVAGYVSQKKKEIFGKCKQSGHLPLEHIPGEAQGDFGDADFYENISREFRLYCTTKTFGYKKLLFIVGRQFYT